MDRFAASLAWRAIIAFAVVYCTPLHGDEKPAAGFETPKAVFDAYRTAQGKADWKTAWECFTPKLQEIQAIESLFGLGMHGEDEKYLKPDFKEPAEVPKTEEERQKLLLSMIRDKFEVYAAGCDFKAKKKIDDPEEWKAPLREVEIDGDRARGFVTRYHESRSKEPGKPEVVKRTPWDMPIYFQKTENGWLLDAEKPAELERVIRETPRRERGKQRRERGPQTPDKGVPGTTPANRE